MQLTSSVLQDDDYKDFTTVKLLWYFMGLSLSAANARGPIPGSLPAHLSTHLRVSYSQQFLQVK